MSENFDNLFHKTIAITGASGLIGKECVKQLYALNETLNADISIVALVRKPEKCEFPKNVKVVEYDLQKPVDVNFDYCIHLAGNATPKTLAESPYETALANSTGMQHIIQAALKNNAKLMYVSSCEVYGESNKVRKEDESASFNTINARNCYPISKLYNENLCACASAQKGLQYNVVRPCFIYGENYNSTDNRVLPQFVKSVKEQGCILMKSKGLQQRMYLHVADCVQAILFVLAKGENGEVYNIPGTKTTIKQIAKTMCKLANVPLQMQIEKNKGASSVKRVLICGDKLKVLGWEQKISLEDGLAKLIN